jgi:hypothetical protein
MTVLCAGRIGTDLAGVDADDGQDWADALRIIRSRYDGHRVLAEAKIMARSIITANWAAIESIARRLDQVGEVSGADVRAIVDAHRIDDPVLSAPAVPAQDTTPHPSTKSPEAVARLKKQAKPGGGSTKRLDDTDDVVDLGGGEDLPAENTEDDENELTAAEQELADEAKKKSGKPLRHTDVIANGRTIGRIVHLADRFVAIRIKGRHRQRVGAYRSSDAAARAI